MEDQQEFLRESWEELPIPSSNGSESSEVSHFTSSQAPESSDLGLLLGWLQQVSPYDSQCRELQDLRESGDFFVVTTS